MDGYPFNIVSHPQYVGSVLTLWGALLLVLNQLHVADALTLAVFWTGLYVVTALQENFL